jgi:hypothetical protein
MADLHKNFAYSNVATAPSPATSGTSLVVTAAQGALFPAVPFNVTVWPASVQPLSTNAEIVTVTAIATDTLTIVRAREGTTARAIIVGDQIAATITAKTLTDCETPPYDAGNISVETEHFLLAAKHLKLTGSERLTARGTATIAVVR